MPQRPARSKLGWISGSLRERADALELLEADADIEPRDELGIAPLRDLLSRAFFPGITTQQKRAKYFLFVPRVCAELESRRSTRGSEARARDLEDQLMQGLQNGPDHFGVVGSKQWVLPGRSATGIYWTGLYEWGIRTHPVALPRYYDWVDSGRKWGSTRLSEEQDSGDRSIWEPAIERFPGILDSPQLRLDSQEARYLRKRILAIREHGFRPLIKDLLIEGFDQSQEFWNLPIVTGKRAELAETAQHAGRLSEAMEGAGLAYNYCCAKKRREWVQRWEDYVERWMAQHPPDEWKAWDLEAALARFQALPDGLDALGKTEGFLRDLVGLLRAPRRGAAGMPQGMEGRIALREFEVKGARARLKEGPALQTWPGEQGVGVGGIQFRWGQAGFILGEIAEAL